MKILFLIIFLLFIIILYLYNNIEAFANQSYNITTHLEAIKNLGDLASTIVNTNLITLPSNVNINGNLEIINNKKIKSNVIECNSINIDGTILDKDKIKSNNIECNSIKIEGTILDKDKIKSNDIECNNINMNGKIKIGATILDEAKLRRIIHFLGLSYS